MKKSSYAGISAFAMGILLSCSVSYGNNSILNAKNVLEQGVHVSLFQDTAAKKAKPSKKAEIDRTKGEAGKGQGKGVDTIPTNTGTGTGSQRSRSDMNRGTTTDKTEQNSDNRGEGAGKNNRAGNSKKGVDTTRH